MSDDKELAELIKESIDMAMEHVECSTTRSLAGAMTTTATMNAMLNNSHEHLLAAHFRALALCCGFHRMSNEDAAKILGIYLDNIRAADARIQGNAPTSGSLQ